MTLGSSELERLADENYKDRRIADSVYCGNCGYNLRTLPFVYKCPECGQAYNARPLNMKGIFVPQETEIPFGDTFSAVTCAAATVMFGLGAFRPLVVWRLCFAVVFLALGLWCFDRAYERWRTFQRARNLCNRIAQAEQEKTS